MKMRKIGVKLQTSNITPPTNIHPDGRHQKPQLAVKHGNIGLEERRPMISTITGFGNLFSEGLENCFASEISMCFHS